MTIQSLYGMLVGDLQAAKIPNKMQTPQHSLERTHRQAQERSVQNRWPAVGCAE
jgi:hypothetical protein